MKKLIALTPLTLHQTRKVSRIQASVARTPVAAAMLTAVAVILHPRSARAQTDVGNTATGTGDVSGYYLVVDQFTTTVPLTAIQIRTYGTVSSGSGNVKVAIYNDNSSTPGTLLFAEVSASVTASTWSTITIPNTDLPAGKYWLAFNLNLNSANVNFITTSAGVSGAVRRFQPWAFGTAFPTSPASTSWTNAAVGVEDCIYFVATVPTTTVVSSSANPSTYGQSVTFTGTVQTNGVTAGAATGTMQFRTNGVDFGSAVTLSSGSAHSAAVSNLAAGTYTVTAIYSGSSSYTTSTGTLSDGQTVNTATVTISSGITANSKLYDTTTGATINSNNVVLSGVRSGDTAGVKLSTNGYTASFATAAVGTNKAVTVSGLSLTGSAAGNYALTQPTGLTANITPADTPLSNIIAVTKAGSTRAVTFEGMPNYVYTVQRTTALAGTSTVWTVVGTSTVNTNGTGTFTDPSPPSGQAFYRTSWP
ncbi:MAG: YDG domain-containing protein [Verrucomicrobiota bacterium]|jgi:hypothetical protein